MILKFQVSANLSTHNKKNYQVVLEGGKKPGNLNALLTERLHFALKRNLQLA